MSTKPQLVAGVAKSNLLIYMKRLSERQADFLFMTYQLLGFIYPSLGECLLKETRYNTTIAEQEKLRKAGKSWTNESKHLILLAKDYALIKNNKFMEDHPLYEAMGNYWISIGGRWGGEWKGKKRDVYHFEYNDKKRESYLNRTTVKSMTFAEKPVGYLGKKFGFAA